MTPEFSRPVRVDAIGEVPRSIEIEADEAERRALARRFGLDAVERLAARFAVSRAADGIVADGRVTASVIQRCTVTGVSLPTTVEEPVRLVFVGDAPAGEEIELGESELDTLPLDGGTADLGEAAAETMVLALDPYPRAPDAEAALRAAGVTDEGEAGPFAALAVLRDKLGGAGG